MRQASTDRASFILGIKVADRTDYVLMAFQLLVIVFFVASAINNLASTSDPGGLVSSQPRANDIPSCAIISVGAVVAA